METSPMTSESLRDRFRKLPASPMNELLCDWDLDNYDDDQLFMVEGPVQAKEVQEFPGGVVLVDGDLHVNKSIFTFGDIEANLVIVLGDVRCTNFFLGADSSVLVTGALMVQELLFASSPDATLVIGGDVCAKMIYSGNSAAWVTVMGGNVQARVLVSYIEDGLTDEKLEVTPKKPEARPEEVFIEAALNRERFDTLPEAEKQEALGDVSKIWKVIRPDRDAIHGLLVEGKPVLRSL